MHEDDSIASREQIFCRSSTSGPRWKVVQEAYAGLREKMAIRKWKTWFHNVAHLPFHAHTFCSKGTVVPPLYRREERGGLAKDSCLCQSGLSSLTVTRTTFLPSLWCLCTNSRAFLECDARFDGAYCVAKNSSAEKAELDGTSGDVGGLLGADVDGAAFEVDMISFEMTLAGAINLLPLQTLPSLLCRRRGGGKRRAYTHTQGKRKKN